MFFKAGRISMLAGHTSGTLENLEQLASMTRMFVSVFCQYLLCCCLVENDKTGKNTLMVIFLQ